MTATYIRPLADEGLASPRLVARALTCPARVGRIAGADGFHITTAAYDDFIADHHLEDPIEAQLATITDPASKPTDQAASAIAGLITSHEIPPAIAAEIARAYQRLGSPPVACARLRQPRICQTPPSPDSRRRSSTSLALINFWSGTPLLGLAVDCPRHQLPGTPPDQAGEDQSCGRGAGTH